MNRLFLFLISAAAVSTANAGKAHHGFHAGAQVGGAFGQNQSNITQTTNNGLNAKHDISATGVSGGLNLGYTHNMGGLAVGAVAEFNGSSASGKANHDLSVNSNSRYTVKVSDKWEGNASVRVGSVMGSALPYVRLGCTVASKKVDFKQLNSGGNKSQTFVGLLVGLGTDVDMGNCMTVGVDFRANVYGTKTAKINGTGPASSRVTSIKVKPVTMNGNVSVKYHF